MTGQGWRWSGVLEMVWPALGEVRGPSGWARVELGTGTEDERGGSRVGFGLSYPGKTLCQV